jgi:hypothetical protein
MIIHSARTYRPAVKHGSHESAFQPLTRALGYARPRLQVARTWGYCIESVVVTEMGPASVDAVPTLVSAPVVALMLKAETVSLLRLLT